LISALPFGFCIYFRQQISSATQIQSQGVFGYSEFRWTQSMEFVRRTDIPRLTYKAKLVCIVFEQHRTVQHVYVFVGSAIDLSKVDHRCWLRVDPLSGVGSMDTTTVL
jgi:hypothetical protein